MKIGVHLRMWGEGGGIGVYTRSLLREMLVTNSDHEFVLFYHDKTLVGQFAKYNHVKELYVPAPDKLSWDQVAVPRCAAKEKVDLLFHPKLAVPLFAHCKTVMVVHGTERFVFPQFSKRSDLLYFRTLYPLFLRRASSIISVSENVRKDLIHYLKIEPHKIHTIYMAPSSHFRQITDRTVLDTVRQKYALPDKFILNVGLIYPGKNIPNLLKALKLVRQEIDVKLVLAGTGRRMHENDLNLIQSSGLAEHVLLPGYIPGDELVAVYNLAQAVVFPSFYESFGLVNIEANACGCPLITSKTGGSPEAAGDAAVFVDPTDPASISDAIRRVLTEPALRSALIEKGFKNAKRFLWRNTASQTLKLFESLHAAT